MKREVIVVGGGLAGLSAAIYLGRAQRDVLVVSAADSMAVWEPDVQNYLGFPEGISGEELVARARQQAEHFGAELLQDEIKEAKGCVGEFSLVGKQHRYSAKRILLATGIYHIPPDIEGVDECLGHSMFFCKDCDGCRVQGKTTIIYGWDNQTVEYALAMLLYSPVVAIVTDGRVPKWNATHAEWVRKYEIPVYQQQILRLNRTGGQIESLALNNGQEVFLEALFTTRGDIYFNKLATSLGAELDEEGQIKVDAEQQTSVRGVYAAGCVTPANCQMIIAAGQGAAAAQAINHDLLMESLSTHALRRFRERQLRTETTIPQTVRT